MTASADDFLDLESVDVEGQLQDLKAMIRWASSNAARSLQKALGPSEVGHPCDRKLAFGMMGEQGNESYSDPLPSIIGTATHAWLESAARKHNELLGRIRWIVEQRVEVRPGLQGTCDLYDCDTQSVIDWKVLGPTTFGKYTRPDPGPPIWYKRQCQLYGKGYRNLGFPVKMVGICFLPRSGQLSKSKLWLQPYDETVAQEVCDRLDRIALVCADLDVENHPERYALIPETSGDHCDFCKHWTPSPDGPLDCKGPCGEDTAPPNQ